MITPIASHTLDQHADALAAYYPGGKIFAAKGVDGSTFRNMLLGLSQEAVRSEGYVKALQDDFIPGQGDTFIDEWERVLAIPDSCFSGTGPLAERWRDALIKLASLGVQTVEDFQDLTDKFGITSTVIPGNDYYNAPGFPFVITEEDSRYYIVVEFVNPNPGFPYTFPFTFGTEVIATLQCLYQNLKPANCEVLFQQV